MEFTCRLGTPSGEIVQGVYIAQSESHLRRELEDKGLARPRPRGRAAAWVCRDFRLAVDKPKIARHEFLVFNQELATLLKAGMPLVQSLDILRTRLANPVFKAVLDDVHEKVRAGTALSDAFQAHGELFPTVYTASLMAGERAGNLDAVLRRFVAYAKVVDTVRKKTISALVYPVILIGLAVVLVGIIVDQGRPDVLGLLRQLQGGTAALDAYHRRLFELRAAQPPVPARRRRSRPAPRSTRG